MLLDKKGYHFQQFLIQMNRNTRKPRTQNDTKNRKIPDSGVPHMYSR